MDHEIRDPVHGFIKIDSDERRVIDSRPLQRLRHIHQLALTYFIYPGATHRRFEHSLGVMEVASRIYDVVTNKENLRACPRAADLFSTGFDMAYWRRVLRMAALCHDVGHLPFSHAAEDKLLPAGWNHERMTIELIRSPEMRCIWKEICVDAEHVSKLAVGPGKYKPPDNMSGTDFTPREQILSDIIVSNTLGADRIDYLLRDSLHAGVAYGRFDHLRLIDCMRILPGRNAPAYDTPTLGITSGGLYCAEALFLARYFMFMQLYYHPVRRIYDTHLVEFMTKAYPHGFSVNTEEFLAITDDDVWTNIWSSATKSADSDLGPLARRVADRHHYKVLYEPRLGEASFAQSSKDAARAVYEEARSKFGEESVRFDQAPFKSGGDNELDFPVFYSQDEAIVSSLNVMFRLFEPKSSFKALERLVIDRVFVDRDKAVDAREWLKSERERILNNAGTKQTGDRP